MTKNVTKRDQQELLGLLYAQYIVPLEQKIEEQNRLLNSIANSIPQVDTTEGVAIRKVVSGVEDVAFAGSDPVTKLYRSHVDFDVTNPENDKEFALIPRTDIVGWWRYERFYEPVFKCLSHAKEDKWLTVGDPFGTDAFCMTREGFKNVLPTNIGEHLLRESKRRGLIREYRVENAEALSFEDNSFDYVLCKEAYHHFPRPMVALYEMLRVAKKAVVLVEPQDPCIDHPAHVGELSIGYERSGNYIYTLSRRELEKVALGLNLPALATKGHVDVWYPGASEILAREDVPEFLQYRRQVEESERQCENMQAKYPYIFAILYKERPVIDQERFSSQFSKGWSITSFPGNPYI